MGKDRIAAWQLLGKLLRHPRKGEREVLQTPLASELAHGVVRHISRLDWVIERASKKERKQVDPAVLDILRLGAYQLLNLPSIPPYAAVSETVDLAKSVVPRASGYVNWALRRITPDFRDRPRRDDISDPLRWLSTHHSFPTWMVDRWLQRFGEEEADRFLAAMNSFPILDLRVNRLKADPGEVSGEIREAGGRLEPALYSPDCLAAGGLGKVTEIAAFTEGRIYIQDEASQLVSIALAPREGEHILDACTGVGGKATHLAELAGDGAVVTALDNDSGRLALLRENCRRLGITSVDPLQSDLLRQPFREGTLFDRILVDAPCSSLGVIRRHPEFKWVKELSDIGRFADLQTDLLCRASDLLKKGGVLAYSTCTTEEEENEGVVRRFLTLRPRFTIVKPSSGLLRLGDLLTPEGFIATFPHRHGTNGGFVSLLRHSPGQGRL